MDKFGLLPSGNHKAIPFETHLENLNEPARTILVDLRNYVMSLGANVIEEVRPHRVTYAKTLTFRTFLDVRPEVTVISLSIRSGRNVPPAETKLQSNQDLENVKAKILEAYQKIQ